ncbi:hypothetical protein HMPREF9418_0238 [Neisseria macacae ATCC 33926]|uniref:Uncharacterized protein n=1 Tax=Neisseria macacae ATCC 33926 TaxID=997348 RepID=A0AA36ULU1_9NEIS|nr:hypothetical protein HMPREF9418_0238 [Neisseria macacae ATCC 33926]
MGCLVSDGLSHFQVAFWRFRLPWYLSACVAELHTLHCLGFQAALQAV